MREGDRRLCVVYGGAGLQRGSSSRRPAGDNEARVERASRGERQGPRRRHNGGGGRPPGAGGQKRGRMLHTARRWGERSEGAPQGLHPTMPTRPIACGAGFGGVMGLVLGWIWGGFGVDRMGMVYARM